MRSRAGPRPLGYLLKGGRFLRRDVDFRGCARGARASHLPMSSSSCRLFPDGGAANGSSVSKASPKLKLETGF